MSDVPRPILRALVGLPVATRYTLTVVWGFLRSADAEAARVRGERVRVRVPQTVIASITGEAPRSTRRHIDRLEAVRAAVRVGRDLDLATLPEHLSTGPTSPEKRTDEPPDRRVLRTDESGEGDRRVPGPTSPPDRRVRRDRTDESPEPDRAVLHKPLLVAPRETPRTSSSYRDMPVKAFRPTAREIEAPRGLGARDILTELAQEAHPPGAVRMTPTVGCVRDLERLLAGDGETPGEDAREVLRVSRAYLRLIHQRVPIARRRGAPSPEDPRWWGPSMYQVRRWAVIVQIVASVETARLAAEAAANAPTRRDPTLARLEAMEREAATGRRMTPEEMEAELRTLRGERDNEADLAEVRARLGGGKA